MEKEIREWMQDNTFYCERLRCHLTPEQCRANRERETRWFKGLPMPEACEKCTEYKELCKQVERRRAMKKKEKQISQEELRIRVDFSKAPSLLTKIKQKAEEEFRPLEMQIIWELKKAIEGRREGNGDQTDHL